MRLRKSGWLLASAVLAASWASRAEAYSSYFTTDCQACHGTPSGTTQTCAACHSHGVHSTSAKSDINLAGAFASGKTTYAPGETVTVTVAGGYRTGWARAVLLDQSMNELARSSCGTAGSGPPQPCATAMMSSSMMGTATLSAPAPGTAGTYTWAVAWYGNKRDASGASFGNGTTSTLTPGSWRDDPNNPNHGWQVVALSTFTVAAAPAPNASVSPTSLEFGSVAVGASSAKTVTVQNTGSAPLTVSSVTRASGTSSEYTISEASVTVPPADSHAITITYAPTDTTTDSGTIALATNDPAHATINVTVSGTGTSTPVATVGVSPASLAFGDVIVGQSSAKTVTVSNTGTAALTGNVALGNGSSAAFTFTPSSLNVAAGASQAVTVTYGPTAEAADSGQLVLTTNDPAHATTNVALSGAGTSTPVPKLAISPTSLDFGTIAQGTNKQLPVQITNGGAAPLTVTGIARCTTPVTSEEFTWDPNPSASAPLTMAPGQDATITVTYTANDLATEIGCITISSNDTAHAAVNVDVTGTGQGPATGTSGTGGTTGTSGTGGTGSDTGSTPSGPKSSGGCSTGAGAGLSALLLGIAALGARRVRRRRVTRAA